LALTNIRNEGRILDRPSFVVDRATFGGREIVRVHVHASRTPPVRYDGVSWVRPGPTTQRVTRDEERMLAEKRRHVDLPFDSHPVPGAKIDDLDLDLFRSTYLAAAVAPEIIEENDRPVKTQLASLRITDPDGTPTVLGLLVLGFDPSSFLPGAYLQFARFDGDDLGAGVMDEQEIRANLVGTSTRLEALLRGHLHTNLVATDGFREQPLATLKNYQSLMPLAHDARKPMFDRRAADGAVGSTQAYVQRCFLDFRALAEAVLDRIAALSGP
jgi:ATP-dependent DNA helicase RecG